MASQRKPSSLLSESISKPVERWPAWIRIIYWCILGAITAVLVATLISCPILLLLRFLHPGSFQTVLTPNQTETILTATPGGSPEGGTSSSGTGSASEGTSASSTATAEAQAESTASPVSPTGSPESSTDSASSSATGTAASGKSKSSATPGGIDSSGSSGNDSELSPTTGTPSAGGSTTSTTPAAAKSDGTPSQPTSATDSAALTATASLVEPSPTSTPIPPSSTPTPIPPSSTPTPIPPSSTPTPIPPSSTPTPTPTPTIPTATPTPSGPTPPPRRTPAPYTVVAPSNPAPPPTPVPLPTNTPRPTSTATPATPTRVAVRPLSTRIVAPAAAPNLPSGILTLIDPISIQIPPSRGPTTFVWEWVGDPLPPEYGFEVRVWLNGEPQAGVHDAVLDRQEGRIDYLGANRYHLKVGNIRYAKGVLGREGIYNWTVAVVRVSPAYTDLGLQAVPSRFRYEPFPVGR